jgi:hypothetical protein
VRAILVEREPRPVLVIVTLPRLATAPVAGDGFHDNDAVYCDADLAHVGEGATRRRCRRFLNVGVIQDDERTLSAQF